MWTNDILTIPTAGTYTLRAEFVGADPDHTPSAGEGRGWLVASDATLRIVRVQEQILGLSKDTRLSPVSNHDFALKLKPATGGVDYEFIPYHGTATEHVIDPPVYYNGFDVLDVAAMSVGEVVEVSSFGIQQHIYGRNASAASPTQNIIEVGTTQTITPDGLWAVDGRWKTLVNVIADSATYVLMLPATGGTVDQLVSAQGAGIPHLPNVTPGSTTAISVDSPSYVFIGSGSNCVAAVRYNNPGESLRVGKGNRPANPTFPEHRTADMAKLYYRLYATGTTIPSGTVHRFSGDYWHGEIPGVHAVTAVL